jgi:probable rRNA maturation factor
MTRPPRSTPKIDIVVDSKRWKDPAKAKTIVRRAITRAAAATRSTRAAELAIVLTDDSAIRVLNRDWRGIDKATNVLSFPAKTGSPEPHLGDIVLAFETVAREARAEDKPFAHHVAHLAVHGFLHLIGYDHERDDDAQEMEQAERKILQDLDIPDPYGREIVAKKAAARGSPKPRSRRSPAPKSRSGKRRNSKPKKSL